MLRLQSCLRPRVITASFQPLQKFFWRRHSVSVTQQVLQLTPVAAALEPDSDPATGSNVWGREETIRRGVDHQTLIHGLRLAPNGVPAASMMIVCVRIHGED